MSLSKLYNYYYWSCIIILIPDTKSDKGNNIGMHININKNIPILYIVRLKLPQSLDLLSPF